MNCAVTGDILTGARGTEEGRSSALRLLRFQPLTLRGCVITVSLGWCLTRQALEHHDLVLLAVCAGGLAAVVWAVVIVLSAYLAMRHWQPEHRVPLCGESGVPIATGERLAGGLITRFVNLEVHWLGESGVSVELVPGPNGDEEIITVRSRREYVQIARRITVSDVLGLARVSFTTLQERHARVLPQRGSGSSSSLSRPVARGEAYPDPTGEPIGDVTELRAYGRGDPLKRILWKIYARTRQLVVRTQERAICPTSKSFVYLVSAEGDEPGAGLAREYLERQPCGESWIFGVDGEAEATSALPDALTHLARSGSARASGGDGLSMLVGRAGILGISSGLLFVPPQPGQWLSRVEATAASQRGSLRAVIGVDGPPQPSDWAHHLLETQDCTTDGWTVEGASEVARRLRQAGMEVVVVDRLTGAPASVLA